MKLIWLTDPHFQLDVPALRRPFEPYVESIAAERPDAVLLGGDLCNRTGLGRFLTAFRDIVSVPIFCVLGNHEYLGSLTADVRTQIEHLVSVKPGLTWLSGISEPAWLADGVALIGADTWGDARVGNLAPRNLRRRGHEFMYDQIEDVRLLWESCGSDTVCIAQELQNYLRAKGDEAALHLGRVGRLAAESARQVLILTHAPPFPEATLHKGKEALNGLPFFCAKAVGDVIKRLAEDFPAVDFTVLSGHTHCGTDMQLMPRLRVLVHDPGGKGISTRWAVLEVDSRGFTWQKPDEFINGKP